MVAWFAPMAPAYVAPLPSDPGRTSDSSPIASLAPPPRWALLNGLALLVLLFLTGVLFYYHADRSITVRLLIELARAPQQRLYPGPDTGGVRGRGADAAIGCAP